MVKTKNEAMKIFENKCWALKSKRSDEFKKLNNKIFRIINVDSFGRVTFSWITKKCKVKHFTTGTLYAINNDAPNLKLIFRAGNHISRNFSESIVELVNIFIQPTVKPVKPYETKSLFDEYIDNTAEFFKRPITFLDVYDIITGNVHTDSTLFDVKRKPITCYGPDGVVEGIQYSIFNKLHSTEERCLCITCYDIHDITRNQLDRFVHFENIKECTISIDKVDPKTGLHVDFQAFMVIRFIDKGVTRNYDIEFDKKIVEISFHPNRTFAEFIKEGEYDMNADVMDVIFKREVDTVDIGVFQYVYYTLSNLKLRKTAYGRNSSMIVRLNHALLSDVSSHNPGYFKAYSLYETGSAMKDTFEVALVDFRNVADNKNAFVNKFVYNIKYVDEELVSICDIGLKFVFKINKLKKRNSVELTIINNFNGCKYKFTDIDIAKYRNSSNDIYDGMKSALDCDDKTCIVIKRFFNGLINKYSD